MRFRPGLVGLRLAAALACCGCGAPLLHAQTFNYAPTEQVRRVPENAGGSRSAKPPTPKGPAAARAADPAYLSNEYMKRERENEAILKRYMSICKGC